VVNSGASAKAAEPCALFDSLGISCEAIELALFLRTDGHDQYVRSAAHALPVDSHTFACCSTAAPSWSLFLVRAYDLEFVGEEGAAFPDGARACGIPIVQGLDELRSYMIDEESASGRLSFEGS
jgi:hypothetical protein